MLTEVTSQLLLADHDSVLGGACPVTVLSGRLRNRNPIRHDIATESLFQRQRQSQVFNPSGLVRPRSRSLSYATLTMMPTVSNQWLGARFTCHEEAGSFLLGLSVWDTGAGTNVTITSVLAPRSARTAPEDMALPSRASSKK